MKKTNKFPYKRVRVYWQDIVSNSEWMTLNIFASHSFDDDGELTVGNITVYPRSVVKKIERLK